MIDALVAGKMHGQPTQRTSKTGKPFAVCKVRVATGAEDSIFVSCIAFDTEAVNALLAPGDKESVALSGSLTPKVWTDNQGNTKPALDMIVHAILTAYHMTRKRRAVAKDEAAASKAPQPGSRPVQPDFNDDLNF